MEIDIRDVLPTIRIPALIVHATGDRALEIGHGHYLADQIPGAIFREIDSDDHLPWLDGSDEILRCVEEFLTGARPSPAISDRALYTIMFTDIVDSTRKAAESGDLDWTDLLNAHHAAVRAELASFHGHEIDTTGDGFVAAFDGPARAIQCANAAIQVVGRLGLNIRVGLHTGECEISGDTLAGLAVHIAARVSAIAGADEILVSRTVKDLVAGSGIAFDDAGVHELKGVPEPWQLYRAAMR